MCFKYKEKKINKLGVVLISIASLALAGLSVFGGIMALKNLPLVWGIVLIVLASIVALGLCALGVTLLFISFSMINTKNSVRDSNEAKGLANARLCDACGKVISKSAEICEHCGAIQKTNLIKTCPKCKHKINATAGFCEKCGFEFKE